MGQYYTVVMGDDPAYLLLDNGDTLDGWRVVDTIPGDTSATIQLPDAWDYLRVDVELTRMESAGTIVRSGDVLYTREPDDYTFGLDRG